MDKHIEILLGNKKNIKSVNVDNFEKIELSIKPSLIHEYDVRNVLSVAEVFDAERNANPNYRIYGRLEYLSLLNGLKLGYKYLPDFFLPILSGNSSTRKDIFNSFDFYLVKPSTGYTKVSGIIESSSSSDYLINEDFNNWVQATPSDYPVGWTVSCGPGSYLMEDNGQAKFVMGSQSFLNLSVLTKEISDTYGEFIVETEVYIEPNLVVGTDLFTLSFANESGFIHTIPMFSESMGVKKYTFSISVDTPINKVSIWANSRNKSLYMKYFKMYKRTSDTTTNYSWDGYVRYFDVIASPKDFEICNVGFAKNMFNEQVYVFNLNKDINISTYFDDFGFPITELYLYAKYIPRAGAFSAETLSYTEWNVISGTSSIVQLPVEYSDRIYGDLVEYSKQQYSQNQIFPQTYYIYTPYYEQYNQIRYFHFFGLDIPVGVKIIEEPARLVWKYNPFIPLRLQYLSSEISRANSGNTSYDIVSSIPSYATLIDNDGNFIWREILPQGYIDPLTGLGVDYPFINKRRYLFANINLSIVPDLDDAFTNEIFREIKISEIETKTQPIGDINDIGKPCK